MGSEDANAPQTASEQVGRAIARARATSVAVARIPWRWCPGCVLTPFFSHVSLAGDAGVDFLAAG